MDQTLARIGVVGLVVLLPAAWGQECPDAGTVHAELRIGQYGRSGFMGPIDLGDIFGCAVASIGDFDGDGTPDLVIGAPRDDDGGTDRGAVWLLFMNADGTVRAHQKISNTEGGFTGILDDTDFFGVAVDSLGDLDGDGVIDLVVSAHADDDGGLDRGAIWILFLNSDGTVKGHQKISDTAGGFTGVLDNNDAFGISVANLGDLDGDGVTDLAVGAYRDDDGGSDKGAVWILFLNSDGTVKGHQKISATSGGFTGSLDASDNFGCDVAVVGDLNGDGVRDIAVGVCGDDDGGTDKGAVRILFLNSDGTVLSHAKISDTSGGFNGVLGVDDLLGTGLEGPGDLDGDGVSDLFVGANRHDDGGTNRGAIWLLFLNPDGSVKSERKISQTEGGFGGLLLNNGNFGRSTASLGDLDGDGRVEIACGAYGSDDRASLTGDVWLLSVNTCGLLPHITQQPSSVLLAFPGGVAQFGVQAEGSGTLFYQWRRDGVDLVDGGNIDGANTATLTVTATGEDVGVYDCVVASDFGQTTSAAAVLAVLHNPCPADFNGDGVINTLDVLHFLNAYTGGCD